MASNHAISRCPNPTSTGLEVRPAWILQMMQVLVLEVHAATMQRRETRMPGSSAVAEEGSSAEGVERGNALGIVPMRYRCLRMSAHGASAHAQRAAWNRIRAGVRARTRRRSPWEWRRSRSTPAMRWGAPATSECIACRRGARAGQARGARRAVRSGAQQRAQRLRRTKRSGGTACFVADSVHEVDDHRQRACFGGGVAVDLMTVRPILAAIARR